MPRHAVTSRSAFATACCGALLSLWSMPGRSFAQPAIPVEVIRAVGGDAGDGFGRSVAMHDGTLVVGANGDDDRGQDAGAAYVFTYDGVRWQQRQKLTPSRLLPGDFFGWSVAIHGDVIVVGSLGDDRNAAGIATFESSNRGAAYVFRRTNGAWQQEAVLQPAELVFDDHFGAAVAVSGDTILVSAIYRDSSEPDAGTTFAFRAITNATGNAAWNLETTFTIGSNGSRSGFSLSLSGGRGIITSPRSGSAATIRDRQGYGWESVAPAPQYCKAVAGTGQAARFMQLFDIAVDGEDALIGDVSCSEFLYRSPGYFAVEPGGRARSVVVSEWRYAYAGQGSVPRALARSTAGFAWQAETLSILTPGGVAGSGPGTGDGTGPSARFQGIRAIDLHEPSNTLFVIDGCAVRSVTAGAVVTTIAGSVDACGAHADGVGTSARFVGPTDLQVVGDDVVVADAQTIRRLSTSTRVVTTIAGLSGVALHVDGNAAIARFSNLSSIAFDSSRGLFVIGDGSTIRRMDPTGSVSTLAGTPGLDSSSGAIPVDGTGPAARVAPVRIAVSPSGRMLFVEALTVREVSPDGTVRTLAGSVYPIDAPGPGGAAASPAWYAAGHPLATRPFSADDENGVVMVGRHPLSRYTVPASPLSREPHARYGAAVAFTQTGALVTGAANGCLWTDVGTCVNSATGTPAESIVFPVVLSRDRDGTFVPWLALPTAGAQARSGFGSALASDGPFIAAGAREWDYRPQEGEPYGEVLGAGAMYVYDLSAVDSDGDTIPDLAEVAGGLDPASAVGDDGATGDPDGDGVSNADEVGQGTHPRASLANARYFAEGAASSFFSTEFGLTNPNDDPVDAVLHFQRQDGSESRLAVGLAPGGARVVDATRDGGVVGTAFATVVESTRPIAVDRIMRWPAAAPYGSHGERGVPAPATRWYFAEGATHSGFDLFYLIQNPAQVVAEVTIRYLRPSAEPLVKTYTVAAASRTNIWVDLEQFPEGSGVRLLADTDVSATIESTVPIIAERAMYLTKGAAGLAFEAGHDSAGVTDVSSSWYFAEGATGTYFDLFLLIANPAGTDAVVRTRYLLPSGETLEKLHTVPATSRYTIWVDHETFDGVDGEPLSATALATTLEVVSGSGVVAERAMWWPGPTAATWSEAHSTPGLIETGTRWAIGAGRVSFDPVPGAGPYSGTARASTYLLVANPGDSTATVSVTITDDSAASWSTTLDVAPRSRVNIDMGTFNGSMRWSSDHRFGAVLDSGRDPIFVEWAVYEDGPTILWAAGAAGAATRIR